MIESQMLVPVAVGAGDEPSVELVIAAWLDSKTKRTGSQKTARAYADGIASFRAMLQSRGCDLDARDGRVVQLAAQAWAGRPRPDGTPAAANTYNQRLAILGSFYAFAQKRGLLSCGNPIAALDRRPAQGYATSRALDFADVAERMAAIDRRTLAGLRDYALLALALQTGRRLSALAALRGHHLEIGHGRQPAITVEWPREKGDKHMRDVLTPAVASALLDWLRNAYPASGIALEFLDDEAPLWVSLAHNGTHGSALSKQAIADICEKRLGTSRVHALRHTFAHGMEQVGAKVSDIQARLGHSSLQTTGRYLAALRSAENAYAADLATLFGLSDSGTSSKRTRSGR